MHSKTTVIGAGLMGSALADTLCRAGVPVTVWNRTPERCAPLVRSGAHHAGSVADAITGSEITVVCISDSADVATLVESLPPDLDLSGRCLVNLSTGSAESTRRIAHLVQARGGEYVGGTILVYPIDIGTENAVLQYAGAADAWARIEKTVSLFAPGGSLYLGVRLDLPAVLDVALTGSTLGVGLASFIEGAAYATSQGVELDVVAAGAVRLLGVLRNEILKAVPEIAEGRFTTDQATLDVWRHGIVEYRDAVVGAGQPGYLLRALVAALDHACEHGHAESAFTAQFAVYRDTEVPSPSPAAG